jgi:oxygen-independent coproporphyrinogen III oxidase
LYIHTPFCSHKCHYCDFYSFVDSKDQQGDFVRRLIAELAALGPLSRGVPLQTIFVGGGTPSLLRVDLWQKVLEALDTHFDLSLIRAGGVSTPQESGAESFGWPASEFTVECNPESTTRELLDVLKAHGVNRVSMGAQSFNPKHLKTLERLHNPQRVPIALDLCNAAGIPRTSMDLIYAVPGQTIADWQDDLQQALALGTTHLSCYNLTYEPNTQMTNRLGRGEFVPIDEDLEADMFSLTGQMLASKGLERYEVSNYAIKGHESRHNLAYWCQEQWLAAGPSASGHLHAGLDHRAGGYRFKNVGNLTTYLQGPLQGAQRGAQRGAPRGAQSPGHGSGPAPVSDVEFPDARRALRERLMTGVRLAVGIHATKLMADVQYVAPECCAVLEAKVQDLASDELLEVANDRWRLKTDRAWLLADFVAKELMKCIR